MERRIMSALLDLLMNRAQQEELQRAFPFMKATHFYGRKRQLLDEESKLRSFLTGSEVTLPPMGETEQWILDNLD